MRSRTPATLWPRQRPGEGAAAETAVEHCPVTTASPAAMTVNSQPGGLQGQRLFGPRVAHEFPRDIRRVVHIGHDFDPRGDLPVEVVDVLEEILALPIGQGRGAQEQ